MKALVGDRDKLMNRNIDLLEQKAREYRATCIQMAHDSGEGHLSSALSIIDILVALYVSGWMRQSADFPDDPDRDRFILSKGHGCVALWTVLADQGYIDLGSLSSYAKDDSPIPNHPCIYALPLLELSSGSLGHGLGVATGMLYSQLLKGGSWKAVILMGDGECNEGSVWESAMFAAANKLERLVAIVDYNRIQAVGRTDEIAGNTSLENKFRAFGWGAITINGNDIGEVCDALDSVPFQEDKPSVIIAKTTGGAGVSFMEDDVLWHYRKPSDEDLEKALGELNANPIHLQPLDVD